MSGQLLFVDLSNNNAIVDFRELARSGVVGCWLKVSEGATFHDQTFTARAAAARAAGLRVGGYHFARPDLSAAEQQATFFASMLGPLERRDLRPVLDLEVPTSVNVPAWVRTFNRTVRDRVGAGPLLYSYSAYLAALKLTKPLGYGLWLAQYGRDDGVDHGAAAPAPWRGFVCHQFSSKGSVAGVAGACDVSHAPKLRPLLARPLLGLV